MVEENQREEGEATRSYIAETEENVLVGLDLMRS